MTATKTIKSEHLTPRWNDVVLSQPQYDYYFSTARINMVAAGRRSFKTEGGKRRLVRGAIAPQKFIDARYYATAPTHQQAKDLFWDDLKALTPVWAMWGGRKTSAISESELTIRLYNGAIIKVAGLDKPARIEGKDWDGGIISEYADCKPNVFDRHIRPMMTRGGWIDIEGVPEGRNHYYEMWEAVLKGTIPGAKAHHWSTEEVLHLWLGKEAAAAEIAHAKGTLDKLAFNQEYGGLFVSFEGLAYYAWDEDLNAVHAKRGLYDPTQPLILCFDFNRSPGVCVYVQELPWKKFEKEISKRQPTSTVTAVIGEVFIRRNSNTPKVCEQIVSDWGKVHKGEVHLYGDPAGGAKDSKAVEGSDWDIIDAALRPVFGHNLKDYVAKSHPAVRARLNSVNSRLVSVDGSVGTIVDVDAAPMFVRDMEGVEADDTGNLIKEDGSPLTHLSDGFGYYTAEEHPCGGGPVFKAA